MNIVMMTNTYLPHVGGVARAVETLRLSLREMGHNVLVIAPVFDGSAPMHAQDVVRVPAVQQFNKSDFSVRLPLPGLLTRVLDEFDPHLIHSHHPFLLGNAALRAAAARNLPLVFTHHTLYEHYTHYVPGDSAAMRCFIVDLATQYANLADLVIAPSPSVERILHQRGVVTPTRVIPTGIDLALLTSGDRTRGRVRLGLPASAFVVGHVGRLAPEKNLWLLGAAMAEFLSRNDAWFLVVGSGPSQQTVADAARSVGCADRVVFAGTLVEEDLADAYRAMDLFAFTSTSETQGLVLAEAMASGLPVVAIDATGVRDIVRHQDNGWLLPADANEHALADAIEQIMQLTATQRQTLADAAVSTSQQYAVECCTRATVQAYEAVLARRRRSVRPHHRFWNQARRMVDTEVSLWCSRAGAAARALQQYF